ncbi:hypothetical protein BFL38_00675 [Brachyspira hampsonii]|uniref:Uncharacterized protein n=1 Tax=Brachyspira hampsonii TaxID=1287055 RepID=A0A1E5NAI5_9SPIR|nr:hypothetical protein [Brachyspira hampsonii]OEJ13111.1 hypothetical protein BFL38_00675 [Brachyspira hampsonii]
MSKLNVYINADASQAIEAFGKLKDKTTEGMPFPSEVSITDMYIYRYVGNNPLYDSSAYLDGRLDRFNFYAIDGYATSSVHLLTPTSATGTCQGPTD